MKDKIIAEAAKILLTADTGTKECKVYNDGFLDGVEFAVNKALSIADVVATLPDDDKRKELTENFYWLNLQNLSGREEFDEAFRLGIMTGIDELSEWLQEGN